MKLKRQLKSWNECEKCDLFNEHHTKAIVEGTLPADLLFVSATPGDPVTGHPISGIPGVMITHMVNDVIAETGIGLTFAKTALVACHSEFAPTKQQMLACSPRLEMLGKFVQPQLIVFVGVRPKDDPLTFHSVPQCEIHWYDSMPISANQLLAYKRDMLSLRDAVLTHVKDR